MLFCKNGELPFAQQPVVEFRGHRMEVEPDWLRALPYQRVRAETPGDVICDVVAAVTDVLSGRQSAPPALGREATMGHAESDRILRPRLGGKQLDVSCNPPNA